MVNQTYALTAVFVECSQLFRLVRHKGHLEPGNVLVGCKLVVVNDHEFLQFVLMALSVPS